MLARPGLAAMCAMVAMTGSAIADPITGDWRTESGETAAIAPCGQEFCITLRTGTYAGRQIGQMRPSGDGRYRGTITDPAEDRTYSGNASLSGNTLAMQGCVAAIFCRTENWTRP